MKKQNHTTYIQFSNIYAKYVGRPELRTSKYDLLKKTPINVIIGQKRTWNSIWCKYWTFEKKQSLCMKRID